MKCDELQIILSFDLERAEKIWHTVVGYCKKKSIDMKEFTYRKDTLKVTKKTYSKNNLIYKIKSDIFLKVSVKNIFKALNFIKSFNSSLINIDCTNYILEYNKSKTDFKLSIDNKILIIITPDTQNRIVIKEIIINDDIIKG